MHRTKMNENDIDAKKGSKVSAGNQGIVFPSWFEKSALARLNLWSKKVNKRRLKNPMLRIDIPVVVGFFFSRLIELMAIHIKKTNPSTPLAISQPRRIIRAKKLNRPKRNVKQPGNLISNNR
jgi:hypothetical protein